MGRQEVIDVKSPFNTGAINQMRIREWAAANAYTLIVMSVFFAVTWIIIIIANLWTVGHGK